jgi:hypothetical protein
MSSVNERLVKSFEKEFKDVEAHIPKETALDLSDIQTFVEKYVKIPEKAGPDATQDMWFRNRPWLKQLYHDDSNRIIIVKGRQMEISEYANNWLLYWSLKKPGKYIYASSSGDKANIFSRDRWQKQLTRSPALIPTIQRMAVEETTLKSNNGVSHIYFMTAYEDTKTLRSIDADGVILDEFQDYRANAIPIAEAGISHSAFNRMLVIGTPLLTGSTYSRMFDDSNKQEFNAKTGQWEVTNPDYSKVWSGYHISQELSIGVPLTYKPDGTPDHIWLTQEQFDYMRKHKPRQEFENEVVGHFYAGLGRPTDYGYMRTLFSPALEKGRYGNGELLIAGVDWGVSASNTVFTLIRPRLLNLPDVYTLDVLYIEKVDEADIMKQIARVATLLQTFPVTLCICDAGAGFVQNQNLYKMFGSKIAQIELGAGNLGAPIRAEPTQFGALIKVNRTWAIDTAMDYITKPERFRFYNETDEGLRDWIINDFLAEYPEMSPATDKKIWKHNPDTTDDALMSLVNAIVGFQFQKGQTYTENVNDWLSWV